MLCAVIVLVSLAIAGRMAREPHGLIDRSDPAFVVADGHTSGDGAGGSFIADCPFSWIDDSTGLVVRPSPSITDPDEGYLVNSHSHSRTRLGWRNVLRDASGHATINAINGRPLYYNVDCYQPTPDGKWLLACVADDVSDELKVVAFKMSRPMRAASIAVETHETYRWIDNGHSWLGLYTPPDGSARLRVITNERNGIKVTDRALPPAIDGSINTLLTAVCGANQAIAIGDVSTPELFKLRVFRINYSQSPATPAVQYSDVTAPLVGPDIYEVQYHLSPDCTKMAWLITFTRYPLNLPKLKGTAAKLGMLPQRMQSIWISNLDGSGAHRIGEMHAYQNDSMERPDWLPSGRRISFLYRHVIYTTPIDGSAGSDD
jgi:hypothetical protein